MCWHCIQRNTSNKPGKRCGSSNELYFTLADIARCTGEELLEVVERSRWRAGAGGIAQIGRTAALIRE